MNVQGLKMIQLRSALQQRGLPDRGRKVELIARLDAADPIQKLIEEAAGYMTDNAQESENGEEEVAGVAHARESTAEERVRQLEEELNARERYWMEKEIDLLRRENELLRASPQQSTDQWLPTRG